MGMHDGNEVRMWESYVTLADDSVLRLYVVQEVVGGIPQDPLFSIHKERAEQWVREIVDEGLSVEDYTGVTDDEEDDRDNDLTLEQHAEHDRLTY